ncbi:EF-hand domain-containing protein [Magnetofaba australis]|nr:EF-hand domain-containing protein [Magnetofaba australis]
MMIGSSTSMMSMMSMNSTQSGQGMRGPGGGQGPQGGPPPLPEGIEPGSAEAREYMSQNLIDEKDVDGDGLISLEESGLDESMFNEIDTDGDGLHSQEEIMAQMEAHEAEIMQRFEEGGMMPPPPMQGGQGLSQSQASSKMEMLLQMLQSSDSEDSEISDLLSNLIG